MNCILKPTILLLFVLVGCNSIKNKDIITSPRDIKTTVIINSKLNIPIFIRKPKSLTNFMESPFISKKEKDTFTLKIKERSLLLISNKEMFTDSIFINPGDSLFLEFSNDYSYNKKHIQKKTDSIKISKYLTNRKIDSLTNLFFHNDYSNPITLFNDYEKIKLYSIKIESKGNSLSRKKVVDLKLALYHETQDKIREGGKLEKGLIRYELFKYLINFYNITKDTSILSLIKSDIFINDSTPLYPFGYSYLYNTIYNVYFKNTQNKSRSRIQYNQFQIYDSLPKYFDSTLVKYGRMISLQQMAEQSDLINKTNSYFKKFKKMYNDSIFNKNYQDSYLINLKQLYNSKAEVNLINTNNKISNLDSLLVALKGKIVYIDYWASWCSPCREAMPSSKKLHEEFKDKNIVFVYFSIDTDRNNWINASRIENIGKYQYNYLILNHKKSNLKNTLKINTIPRYLLYDKKGNLIHPNAPGPDSKEIRVLLNQYLKE